MSQSNFRIIKESTGLGVYEVWYNRSGAPSGTFGFNLMNFKTLEELAAVLDEVRQAQYRPILEFDAMGNLYEPGQ